MVRFLAFLFASGLIWGLPAKAGAQGGLDWSHLLGPSGLSVQKTLDQCVTTSVPATVNCTFNVVITANVTASWGPITISDASSAWMTNVSLTHNSTVQNCQVQHATSPFYHNVLQLQVVSAALACSLPAMSLNTGDTVSLTITASIDLNQGHPNDLGEFRNCIVIDANDPASGDRASAFSCVRFPTTPVRPTSPCRDAPGGMVFWSQFDTAISPSFLPNPPSTSPHLVNANRQLITSDLVDLTGNLHPGRFLRLSPTQSRVQYLRPASGPSPFAMGTHDFSIDAWVRIPANNAASPASGHFLMDMRTVPAANNPNRGVALFVDSQGRLTFQMALNAALASQQHSWTTSNGIADGQWHHIAVTVDRDQVTGGIIWIDGSPASLNSGGVTFDPSPYQTVSIGAGQTMVVGFDRLNQSLAAGFDIDEIEVFHRVLAPMEIRDLVTAPKCR